jgi:hypothetical protein
MRKQRERFVKIREVENKVHSRKQLLFTTIVEAKIFAYEAEMFEEMRK